MIPDAYLRVAAYATASEPSDDLRAMVLAEILFGRAESRRAAYHQAVEAAEAFTHLDEPDTAAAYEEAARWMVAHGWHNSPQS